MNIYIYIFIYNHSKLEQNDKIISANLMAPRLSSNTLDLMLDFGNGARIPFCLSSLISPIIGIASCIDCDSTTYSTPTAKKKS